MEKWEESEQIQRKQNSPGENQIPYNVSNKCTKQKISKIVEQMDFTGNGYDPSNVILKDTRTVSALWIG